ncbi:hypothetical protein JG687_00014053 [Phytophthora cactorum]|uniref:Uncharacterized protein n=1 Tax=Phytophthora cactorum TaxID=29920 RepID=A0A8T1TXW0_9STRA|nr:hypothetical protein JG687_00014053 [Phytophthora cactorum]
MDIVAPRLSLDPQHHQPISVQATSDRKYGRTIAVEIVEVLCSYFTGFDAFNLSLTNAWWRNYLSDDSEELPSWLQDKYDIKTVVEEAIHPGSINVVQGCGRRYWSVSTRLFHVLHW